MKAVLLAGAVIATCIVLFVAGVVAPKRSRKMQKAVDHFARRGEGKATHNAGRLGDLTQKALTKSRRAADASARAGRRLRGESS